MSLSLNNLCIGNVILRITECDSTNVFARNLMSKSEPIEGTVVLTDKQTEGKGQIGNKWQSKAYENLTFSIILKPSFLKPERQFMLSKIVSLACIETFQHFTNENFQIKWPNDIYYQKKKLGGILIENSISANKIVNSIIGVGLNINQVHFHALPKAISLKDISDKAYDLESVLVFYLKRLDAYYFKLRNGKVEEIDNKYLESLFGHQQKMIFNENGVLFEAKVEGVNQLGQLVLELENGYQRNYNFKEISWHF